MKQKPAGARPTPSPQSNKLVHQQNQRKKPSRVCNMIDGKQRRVYSRSHHVALFSLPDSQRGNNHDDGPNLVLPNEASGQPPEQSSRKATSAFAHSVHPWAASGSSRDTHPVNAVTAGCLFTLDLDGACSCGRQAQRRLLRVVTPMATAATGQPAAATGRKALARGMGVTATAAVPRHTAAPAQNTLVRRR